MGQKYLHDLEAWDTLAVEEHERAIGMPFGRVVAGEFGTYFIGYAQPGRHRADADERLVEQRSVTGLVRGGLGFGWW